jgi:hypothetical protein
MSISRRTFLCQAGAATAAAVLSQPILKTSSAQAADSAALSCSLPDDVETTVQGTISAVSDLQLKNPALPGFASFDRYFAAAYPQWLSEDDSTLLLGALYLKSLDLGRVYITTPGADAVSRQLEAPLRTELLGPDFFKRLLEDARRQVAANPEALAVYQEAAARALGLTDIEGLSVYGKIEKIRRAAYVVGVVVGAFVKGFIDGFFG